MAEYNQHNFYLVEEAIEVIRRLEANLELNKLDPEAYKRIRGIKRL